MGTDKWRCRVAQFTQADNSSQNQS